jgi:hypothetical protein
MIVVPKTLAPEELVRAHEADERGVIPVWDTLISYVRSRCSDRNALC